jgi:hypothetical protein
MTLDEIAALKDDWDGQGAKAPSVETIKVARDFEARWPIFANRITVSPDGTIIFEWQYEGRYAEAEVYADRIEWMNVGPRGKGHHWEERLADAVSLDG